MPQMVLPLLLLPLFVIGSLAAKSKKSESEVVGYDEGLQSAEACAAESAKLRTQLQVSGEALQDLLKTSDVHTSKLKVELEAARAEIAALKKSRKTVEVPYVSTKVILDSLGAVIGQGSLNLDLAPVYTAADASYGALQAASLQATEMASQGSAAAQRHLSTAAEMAQDLHGKHVSEHTKEYYDTAMKTYTTHLAPHVDTARKVYDQSGAAYVDMATAGIYAGIGAVSEGGKSLSPKLSELWQQGMKILSGASGGKLGDQFGVLTKPRTVEMFGRSRTFEHGIVDIILAALQGACVLYVAVRLLWKLFLKTLIWNIGLKFFGKTVCINLTAKLVKVSFRLTQIILRVLYTLVFTVFGLVLTCIVLPIGIGGGLGVGLLHLIEKNAAVGLSTGQRLGLGAGAGTLVWWLASYICCGRCCGRNGKKKLAEARNNGGTGKPASAKGAPAKTDKSDAKGRAEAAKGSNKKK